MMATIDRDAVLSTERQVDDAALRQRLHNLGRVRRVAGGEPHTPVPIAPRLAWARTLPSP